jgi:HK97 family phage major capsid protein
MKTVKILQEERGAITAQIQAFTDKAKEETRTVTDDEYKQMQALAEQREAKDKEIAKAQFLKEEELRQAADEARSNPNFNIGNNRNKEGEGGEKRQMAKEYRISDAIKALLPGAQKIEGRLAELHQEGEKEAREAQCEVQGSGIVIPSFARGNNFEQRASSVGTATAGGHTVATDLGGLIPVLEPNLMAINLGAQLMPGMVGNFTLPKQTAYGTANWETETSAADSTDPTFGTVAFTPKRLAAYTDFSLQLLRQSSIGIENLLRGDLNRATDIKVDAGVLFGTGSGQMKGILTLLLTANRIVGGANGAAPDYDDIIDLETAVNVQNALMDNLAYLTTPGVKGKLKKTKIDAGSGEFVWSQNSKELNSYRAETSTQVPSTLDKGTSTGVCHAIIFGDWSKYVIPQWGPVEVLVDPYTQALTGQVRIVMNSFWDGNSRYDQSFAAMIDALV